MKVTTHVHTCPVSNVAGSIVDHATREFTPDLIVTCTHGRSGVRDVLFGSIAQQIVAQGVTPLLLIRPGSPEFKLEKILAPLDPNSIHDDGLPLTEALAKAFGAELLLLSVVPTFSSLTGEQAATSSLMPATTQAMLEIREEDAATHLQEHIEQLQVKRIKATAEIARGDPAGTDREGRRSIRSQHGRTEHAWQSGSRCFLGTQRGAPRGPTNEDPVAADTRFRRATSSLL